ncbi:MAG: Polyribonucleotide nucleotidyltransferase [Syntrophomonadaceae bacterium]|nr:Polyribonucleotide nucleotidyltransferase [Bacillota bacterium]
MVEKVEMELEGKKLSIETGRMAKLADGATVVRYGDTVVVTTVVTGASAGSDIDHLPLSVDYRERTYAAGRIPGGFFRREGRPTEKEILTSRLIDRPIRPLLPSGMRNDIQIISAVLSADAENDSDILAVIGASAAMGLSGAPYQKLMGAVRIGRLSASKDGNFIVNPTNLQIAEGNMDLVVAGTVDGINMVEGAIGEVSEEIVLDALLFGHEALKGIISLIETLIEQAGSKEKRRLNIFEIGEEIKLKVEELTNGKMTEIVAITERQKRQEKRRILNGDILNCCIALYPGKKAEIMAAIEQVEKRSIRQQVLAESKRIDGRSIEEIRPISCEVGVLPRTHGSALFTRGQTQSLVITTLGTSRDEQRMDELAGEYKKAFMLHYNFPPFSTGEVKPMRGPGRREIGHGALAERALRAVIPSGKDFPYTIRIVSDILESNGSSSMATVCGGSLSLMDAGVLVKSAVAGVAMGLIKEGNDFKILTDISGAEDYFGDMDCKIAGTRNGITAIQMDLKVDGVDAKIMKEVLSRAQSARMSILDKMDEAISSPRSSVSQFAPTIVLTCIDKNRIGDLIGPGGKNIREIMARTDSEINVDDSGEVSISAPDSERAQQTLEMVKALTSSAEVGVVYPGKVKKIMDFGAFVEILPKQEGLLHISQLADYHVKRVEDEVKVHDEFPVKVIRIDADGKISLSRKAVGKNEGKSCQDSGK